MGSDVETRDSVGARRCWLSQTMARHFFQNESPVGQRMVVHYSFGDDECEVVGVVADARTNTLRGEWPRRFYMPFGGAFSKPVGAIFELRIAGDPTAVVPALRGMLHDTNA